MSQVLGKEVKPIPSQAIQVAENSAQSKSSAISPVLGKLAKHFTLFRPKLGLFRTGIPTNQDQVTAPGR